ncbi:MAG: hypothetical protein J1F31_06640 [Erysipelotrichales bacterium]|nr:hypothetical protein [Erysipelotrichales bacterium]
MELICSTELDILKTSPLYFFGEIVQMPKYFKYHFTNSLVDLLEVDFDIDGKVISKKVASHKSIRYKSTLRQDPNHYSYDSFVFDNYTISHKNAWGYQCHKDGKLIWTKSLKGYLYTEIEKYGDNIVFGTAGYGGHFYSLNLRNGNILFDFNTKGTSQFFYVEGYFYICMRNSRSTDLLKISTEGKIIENIKLQGTYHDYYCPFNRCDNKLFVVTLKELKNNILKPIIHCVSIV